MASLEEIRNERLKKLAVLKEMGVLPYPIVSNVDATLLEAVTQFFKLSKRKKPLSLVGRIMSVRGQGALIFFDLNDGTGVFQGLLKRGEIEDAVFELFRDTVDIVHAVYTHQNLPTADNSVLVFMLKELMNYWVINIQEVVCYLETQKLCFFLIAMVFLFRIIYLL